MQKPLNVVFHSVLYLDRCFTLFILLAFQCLNLSKSLLLADDATIHLFSSSKNITYLYTLMNNERLCLTDWF